MINPFDVILLFISGVVVFAGFTVASLFPSDRMKEIGLNIMFFGAMLGGPSTVEIAFGTNGVFVGDADAVIPYWYFDLVKTLMILGAVFLFFRIAYLLKKNRAQNQTTRNCDVKD